MCFSNKENNGEEASIEITQKETKIILIKLKVAIHKF